MPPGSGPAAEHRCFGHLCDATTASDEDRGGFDVHRFAHHAHQIAADAVVQAGSSVVVVQVVQGTIADGAHIGGQLELALDALDWIPLRVQQQPCPALVISADSPPMTATTGKRLYVEEVRGPQCRVVPIPCPAMRRSIRCARRSSMGSLAVGRGPALVRAIATKVPYDAPAPSRWAVELQRRAAWV